MALMTAVGMMSGTSMDGIDVALVRTDGEEAVEFGPSMAVEYDSQTRARIGEALAAAKSLSDRNARPGCLDEVEAMLTQLHADALNKFLAEHERTPAEIDLVGFHGQTVLHRPDIGLTVQLGDGAALARAGGIDVIFDMRARDMTLGGEGAPLVPVFHRALAKADGKELPVAFVNIGGIANISCVGEGGELVAFDTGPGNNLIDQWMQQEAGVPFDQGGKVASEGTLIQEVVERYMAAPYFTKRVPKSLDRSDFAPLLPGEAELSDGARTLANVSARSIMGASDHLPVAPKRWIISGGGRLNQSIMEDLRALATVRGAEVISAEEAGFDGDMMEAQAFAYLAVRSAKGLPLTYPTTTGCREPATGGVLARA